MFSSLMTPGHTNRMGYFALALVTAVPALGVCQDRQIHFRELSPQVIRQRLETVARKNADREQALKKLLEAVGCQAERLTEQSVTRTIPPNVICTLPGATASVILVGAHFDHVPTSYGVIDDWSGASLLPSLYESLDTVARKHTFVFVGFTNEEKGLIGSGFYVKHLTAEEISRIRAMVNLDSLALGPTKVWASRADHVLLSALVAVAQSFSLPLQGMSADQVGKDDTFPFAAKKVPTVSLHSLTQENWQIAHTPRDAMAAVRMSDFYESYRLIAAYLAYLDGALD